LFKSSIVHAMIRVRNEIEDLNVSQLGYQNNLYVVLNSMAIRVVEFSNGVYKIRNIFA
jgi:hypothetical protein